MSRLSEAEAGCVKHHVLFGVLPFLIFQILVKYFPLGYNKNKYGF